MGARRRFRDEAILTRSRKRRPRGRRALEWNADDETTLFCLRLSSGARPRDYRGARGRRGSHADLPRSAACRSRHRRGPGQLGGDAGEGAAGARRAAAERQRHGRTAASTTTTRRSRATRGRTSTGISISTPRSCRQRSRFSATRTWSCTTRPKQQVTQADFVLSSAQQDLIVRVARRVLRHPARPVQHRARREPEESGRRAARAGEAQLRGRRRDDHRYQRGAGEIRCDRGAGDHRAQRVRQSRDRRFARSSDAIRRI